MAVAEQKIKPADSCAIELTREENGFWRRVGPRTC